MSVFRDITKGRHSSNKYFLKSEANKSKGYNFLISTTFVTWDLLTFTVLTFLNLAQNELPSVRLPTPAEEQTHTDRRTKGPLQQKKTNSARHRHNVFISTCIPRDRFPELPSAPVSAAPPRRPLARRHRRPAGGASTHSGTQDSRGFEVKRGNILISTRECGQTEEKKWN